VLLAYYTTWGILGLNGVKFHQFTHGLVPEERRLAAEEGTFSKKTWLQKNEDGGCLSCPFGLHFRRRVLTNGTNTVCLCVCVCV